MFNKAQKWLAALGLLGGAVLLAQDAPLANNAVRTNFPPDSPVLAFDNGISMGASRATARGGALMLDLHVTLMMKNLSAKQIRGVRLRVVSQEVAMGGVGSVYEPSLNVGPNETFPVHIEMRLMRPVQMAGGPLVQVNLDGVLFQDLSFYGPDQMQSRRIMTANEREAQRDRDSLKRLLAQQGPAGLKDAMLRILTRQEATPRLQGKVVRGEHSITNAGVAAVAEHQAQFAMLKFPDAPVEAVDGSAMVAGSQARDPNVQVHNLSGKPVNYVELGWVVTDPAGHEYMALTSTGSGFSLAPGGSAHVRQEATLDFSPGGQPVNIQKITSFVNQVQFADGSVWVPSRQNLENPLLVKVLAPSVEEERLADLYRRKGPEAVAEELKKF